MDTCTLTTTSHRVYCAALLCFCQQRNVCKARYTKKCGVLSLSQWIHLHSFHCTSLLGAHSNYQQLRSATTVHILSPPLSLGKENRLLLVHSCSFDTTLSLACEDALHIALFAVKPGYFLPFYCPRQRKNSGSICVQTQRLRSAFVLWLAWDGGSCGMFLYKRNNDGEDPEACKRWMHALITVMVAALCLLCLKCFVTPSFWTSDAKFCCE